MANNIENHSIFIKNSKLILGSITSVDKKRRTYEVISLDSKKNSFGFKDLIYDLEDNRFVFDGINKIFQNFFIKESQMYKGFNYKTIRWKIFFSK